MLGYGTIPKPRNFFMNQETPKNCIKHRQLIQENILIYMYQVHIILMIFLYFTDYHVFKQTGIYSGVCHVFSGLERCFTYSKILQLINSIQQNGLLGFLKKLVPICDSKRVFSYIYWETDSLVWKLLSKENLNWSHDSKSQWLMQ